jgi:hypothetical protein
VLLKVIHVVVVVVVVEGGLDTNICRPQIRESFLLGGVCVGLNI